MDDLRNLTLLDAALISATHNVVAKPWEGERAVLRILIFVSEAHKVPALMSSRPSEIPIGRAHDRAVIVPVLISSSVVS